MQAVAFNEYGTVDVLRLIDAPRPEPGPAYVRIRIHAAAVNPADSKWRQGMFQSFSPVRFPHILGYDVAGTVDAVGANVADFNVGDRVFALLDSATKGGYAEYVVVPATTVVTMPMELDFAVAAAIPTAGLTGVQMVEDYAAIKAGQNVLITGATGNVGRFALHAARARGAHIVAAVRASQFELARNLGASDVLTLGETAWSGRPFDFVIDTVGGDAVATLCRHVSPEGKIFTAATTPINPDGLVTEPIFVVVRQDAVRLAQLAYSIAAGELSVPIAQRMPLSAFKEAQMLVDRGGNPGKIILEPLLYA